MSKLTELRSTLRGLAVVTNDLDEFSAALAKLDELVEEERRAQVRYRVSQWSPEGEFDSEVFFSDQDRAMQSARAITRPGSISADVGDKVIVERVTFLQLEVLTKTEE